MNRLNDIPIRVEAPVRLGGLGGGVSAILSELAGLLEEVARGSSPASIDLRSLPMSAEDRDELQRLLGSGEVQATLEADGLSTLRETGVPGIWWVEHRDREGKLIAELLEVTHIPQILECASDDMTMGAESLRKRIAGTARADEKKDHETRQ